MTFEHLNLILPLEKRLRQLNYTHPTEIQKKAIPIVLSGKDVLASAQTGTGKTAAFGLPVLHHLSKIKQKASQSIKCLVIAPTRELAAQIGDELESYAKLLSVSTAVVYGGVKIQNQISKLNNGVDILVATPGRFLDLYSQKAVSLSACNRVILDEADRMLDMGFVRDIKYIFSKLPKERQTMLFSATYSQPIRELAKNFLKDPVEISINRKNTTAKLVKQSIYPVDQKQKSSLLARLINKEQWQQVLVFTRTKHGSNRLVTQLEKQGLVCSAIHGNKSQSARIKALDAFKSGAIRVLVATDIAARGLDISQLPVVINYELPQSPEDYVHRIGRTGRAGCKGQAISLVCYEEYSKLLAIEKLISQVLPRVSFENFMISNPLPHSHLNRKPVKHVAKNKNQTRTNKDGKKEGNKKAIRFKRKSRKAVA